MQQKIVHYQIDYAHKDPDHPGALAYPTLCKREVYYREAATKNKNRVTCKYCTKILTSGKRELGHAL